jgi:hypothetical protein
MLDLRCVAINGQWEHFTQFRIQRETQRLYPYRALFQGAEKEWPIAA